MTTTLAEIPLRRTKNKNNIKLRKIKKGHKFLIINTHLYILHNNLFGVLDIKDDKLSKFQIITKWMKFYYPILPG